MTQSERKTQTIQFQSWEVGGELLDILSRGLYSDAKDALREYVQNGVDAKARNIIITVDGSRAVIRDDGRGWTSMRCETREDLGCLPRALCRR